MYPVLNPQALRLYAMHGEQDRFKTNNDDLRVL